MLSNKIHIFADGEYKTDPICYTSQNKSKIDIKNLHDDSKSYDKNDILIVNFDNFVVPEIFYRYEKLVNQRFITLHTTENKMLDLLKDVLKDEYFYKFGIAVHVPLSIILPNFNQLINDREKEFVHNILTHVDFLIFAKLGKIPLLVIEIDGPSHTDDHKQVECDTLKNNILEKYGIPIKRFPASMSYERDELIAALNFSEFTVCLQSFGSPAQPIKCLEETTKLAVINHVDVLANINSKPRY